MDQGGKEQTTHNQYSFFGPSILKTKFIKDADEILTPVYLNKSRSTLLFSVRMKLGHLSKTVLYQKGLALIAWN